MKARYYTPQIVLMLLNLLVAVGQADDRYHNLSLYDTEIQHKGEFRERNAISLLHHIRPPP